MTHDAITPNPVPPAAYPVKSRSPWEFFLDHNPFYLLSVLLMLFGCYAINNSLNVAAGELTKLLLLLGILNLYECLLIALGIYLLPQKGVERDGKILLLLEALFLADATFLNAETVMTSPFAGALLNLLLLALAVGKIWLMLRAMRIPLTPWRFGFLALQLALLWSMPLAFRHMGPAGEISPLAAFGVWWIIGLLPVLFDLLAKFIFPHEITIQRGEPRVEPALVRVYLILPFLSLIAHLGFMHWIYQIDFFMAHLSPILFGIAISMNVLQPSKFARTTDIGTIRVLLATLGVLFALGDCSALTLTLLSSHIHPILIALAGAYLTLAYCFAFRHFVWFVLALAIAALAKVFGPSLNQIFNWIEQIVRQIDLILNRLIPTTAAGWGIVAVASSFIMLMFGAAVSYIKGQRAK